MKQCTVGIALVASMLVTLAAAGANPDSRNGATWYWRAIDRLDRIDRRDWEIIDRYRADPSAGPTNELRAVLARSGPMLELFRRGTRQPYADFDLDWSQGFELRLPHLGRLRKITRVAQADALVHLADGNGAGAAMRIASIYGLADHFESDRIMISSLLGRAIFDTAEETAQAGFDRAVFDKLSAETLLRAVRRIDSGDPFGFVESVAGEQEMAVSWIGDRFAAQEDRADMLDAFWLDPDPEMSEQIGAMTDEEFVEGLETYDRMMDRIVLAFENPDMEAGRAARVEIEKELEAGEHGLLARIFTPAFTFVHDQMKDAREHVRVRREMLEGIVQGEIALQQHANAAWYYARAFEKLRGEPPFPLDELFAVAIDEARPIGDRLAARLDTSTPVVDLLREGSVLARCDFSGLRPRGMQRLCPDDLAGMR
ncbi:MAG: hypothetical protein GY715_08725, partial [Planctomycetes bacterium]|nr:hypothetical protein [Planctomycetota bacterium]